MLLTSSDLADFFIFLFEVKGLQPITIKGYRSAIARVYRLCNRPDPGIDQDLSHLLNNFCLERPKRVILFPKWSLDVVLHYLAGAPFEPLDKTEFKYLTMKTVFLTTLATAGRVSEIHALSARPECLRFNQDGSVCLTTFPGFIAKNRLPQSGPQQYTIQPLQDEVFCPVRALSIYLKHTESSRKDHDSLFIPLRKTTATSPQLISSWIKTTIQDAYKEAEQHGLEVAERHTPRKGRTPRIGVREPPSEGNISDPVHSPATGDVSLTASGTTRKGGLCVQKSRKPGSTASVKTRATDGPPDLHRPAHELRALSSSLALYRGAALEDITKAVGWSSSSTFGRFYLRHMGPVSDQNVRGLHLRLPASPVQNKPSH